MLKIYKGKALNVVSATMRAGHAVYKHFPSNYIIHGMALKHK
jgi:hypothetical protein